MIRFVHLPVCNNIHRRSRYWALRCFVRTQIYQNSELQALISAIGLGVRGVEFDQQQLRYHRVIIMCDADVRAIFFSVSSCIIRT